MVRDEDGKLVAVSWPQALDAAARGLAHAGANTGVLAGGRLTVEDAYAYVKFARMVLGTNNIDFRARAHSTEEAAFLGSVVAGRGMSQTYAALESAPAVLLAGFEPEEESPIVFLRLRAPPWCGSRAGRASAGPWRPGHCRACYRAHIR
ncbi:NADH-quinone oxidoreductase subunit G [Mycobacteroides abscessus subsp. abscessus]|nr:NADH-quinone oxidoreductase subunit G [Mycobacteroides abscessus subsp. abscessus]